MSAVKISIDNSILERAAKYSQDSLEFTSRNNDYHSGGETEASRYMRLGKIGEFAFESYLISRGIEYVPDETGPDTDDDYDFMIGEILIDVKTRTETYHRRTLERVIQYQKKPKDIYVSVKYIENIDPNHAYILGFITSDILTKKYSPKQFHPKGQPSFYVYDNDLIPIEHLLEYI